MRPLNNKTIDLKQLRKELVEQIDKTLENPGCLLAPINIKIDPEKLIENTFTNVVKPTVIFSAIAWAKLNAMTQRCSKEVSAHGVVERDNEIYFIKDILPYPQIVTGVTVESDDEHYHTWLLEQDSDTINHMRLHFHSHVNMGVTPSGTDTAFQLKMLQSVKDFYIFIIFNKRQDMFINIYDYTQGILFENKDISYDVLYEHILESMWYSQATGMITEYVAPVTNYSVQTFHDRYEAWDGYDITPKRGKKNESIKTTRVSKSKYHN